MEVIERAKRVVMVVAHPDDEVIGAGMLMPYLQDLWIIHTTDGSPLDLTDAKRNGFVSREEYAAARQRELDCALGLANVLPRNRLCLGFTDKETMHHLPLLCQRIEQELDRLQPDLVLTQPYEGGHPDHDSTAFAVHRYFGASERLCEMTSYHRKDGMLETGAFLDNGNGISVSISTAEDVARKQSMLACFISQEVVLRDFPVVAEQFRPAPRYDFLQPPHAGTLHYETLPWGITGEQWRALAARCG